MLNITTKKQRLKDRHNIRGIFSTLSKWSSVGKVIQSALSEQESLTKLEMSCLVSQFVILIFFLYGVYFKKRLMFTITTNFFLQIGRMKQIGKGTKYFSQKLRPAFFFSCKSIFFSLWKTWKCGGFKLIPRRCKLLNVVSRISSKICTSLPFNKKITQLHVIISFNQ